MNFGLIRTDLALQFLTIFWSFQHEFSFNGRFSRNPAFRLHLNFDIRGDSMAFEFIDHTPINSRLY